MVQGSAALPWRGERCMIGIDEAGRGPVLGPMVYGCAFCPISAKDRVGALGFDDSKKLSEAQRDKLYDVVMNADDAMGWAVDVVGPEELSAQMLSRDKVSLNAIAFESTCRLIAYVLNDVNANVCEAYVDTVGDADRYATRLQQRFPSISFTVKKKADSLFAIVSAASIVAKVTRDRCLRDWVLHEQRQQQLPCNNTLAAQSTHSPAAHVEQQGGGAEANAVQHRATGASTDADAAAPSHNGADGDGGGDDSANSSTPGAANADVDNRQPENLFGSGYPADPGTKVWLLRNCEPVFGFPSLVRFSWGTCKPLLDENCVPVHWDDDDEEEETRAGAAGGGASGGGGSCKKRRKKLVRFESSAPQRHSFFRSRQLQQVSGGLQ